MALKTFKPYTKSTRGTILIDRTGLWKGKPFKSLFSPKNSIFFLRLQQGKRVSTEISRPVRVYIDPKKDQATKTQLSGAQNIQFWVKFAKITIN